MYRLIKFTMLLHLLPRIEGAITLNCRATSPASPKSVTCSCENLVGIGVQWLVDTEHVSHCLFSYNCSHYPSGKTFLLNQTEKMITMTVNSYNFSDCQQFTCKDFVNTSIQQSHTPSTIDFDSTMPSVIAEPVSNNTSGDISITTSCISGYSDLVAEWYIVVDGTKQQYIPDQDVVIKHINVTACTACNNEPAATIKVGFKHNEAVDNEASEGHFQLELHHPNYPLHKLVRKTTNVYKVTDFDENEECNWCPKFCLQESEGACIIITVGVVVVVGVIVVGVVVLAFTRCCRCKGKTCDTPSKESIPLREVNTTGASHDKLETTPMANGKSSTKRRFGRVFRLLEDCLAGTSLVFLGRGFGFGGANKHDEEKPNTQKTLSRNVKPMLEIMEKILELLDPDDNFYKRVLNRSFQRFLEDLDPEAVLNLFLEKKYLDYTQVRAIKEQRLTSDKTREIIKKVGSKGVKGYKTFKEVLRESHQEHFAELLDKQERILETEIQMAEKEKSENDGQARAQQQQARVQQPVAPEQTDKLVQLVVTVHYENDKLVQTVETVPNVKDLQSNLHELDKQIQEILTYRGAEEVTNTLEKFRGDMRQVLISLDSQIVEEKNLIQFEEEESHICEDRAVFTGILGKDLDEKYDTPSKESLALQEGNNTRASDEESGKKCGTPSNEYTNSSVKCQTDSSRETIRILNVLDRLRTEIKECKDTTERIMNERHSKHLTQSSDSTEVSIVQ